MMHINYVDLLLAFLTHSKLQATRSSSYCLNYTQKTLLKKDYQPR